MTDLTTGGTVVGTEGSLSVALDASVTEPLAIEGVAREIINRVQGERRTMDLDVTDRVVMRWTSDDEPVRRALDEHADLIAGEVLATRIEEARDVAGDECDLVGHTICFTLELANT